MTLFIHTVRAYIKKKKNTHSVETLLTGKRETRVLHFNAPFSFFFLYSLLLLLLCRYLFICSSWGRRH